MIVGAQQHVAQLNAALIMMLDERIGHVGHVRAIAAVICRCIRTEEVRRLRKRRSTRIPPQLRPRLHCRQHPLHIHTKERLHEVNIARGEHRPVHMPRVLHPVRAAPEAIVRILVRAWRAPCHCAAVVMDRERAAALYRI